MIVSTENPNVYKIEEKDLDIFSMSRFELELDAVLNSSKISLYLDFENVEQISSGIIGILLAKQMKLKKRGLAIELLHLSNSIKNILKILNLRDYFLSTNCL
ncbi:STAS domain-containing protein [Leptospira sp. GIMC2001]|uniref:STAS domain-containing protein n=1 Tax=Leptospira sp. GIMC2001 TaxID=1513297 RepID=UPI00234AA640|nr:STAS domain-containing protein [Leptospira sp. GIMC2001]WCL50052.1 STAS domain-containing protein [Leptospira sp. GIMC2001]